MVNSIRQEAIKKIPPFCIKLKLLLVTGSFVQVFSTLLTYILGKFNLLPNWISSQGILVGDAQLYIEKCSILSEKLVEGNFLFLISSGEQIHLRLYSISYFLLSNFFGANILSFQLVNLPLFLLILTFIYKIGEIVFESRIGLISSFVVLFFPSFLLHTTQPLRDVLLISIFLLFILLLVSIINKPLGLGFAFPYLVATSFTFFFLWLIRDNMFLICLGITLIAFLIIIFKNLKKKSVFRSNLMSISILLLFILFTPNFFSNWIPIKEPKSAYAEQKLDEFTRQHEQKGTPDYLIKLSKLRYGFALLYPTAGSNLDADYNFNKTSDFVFFLPRAIAIGLFAPFPNAWFEEGRVFNITGRIVAGFETFGLYVFSLFALISILKNPTQLVSFLVLNILLGATALGLVVINIGALYRMRYVFWFLLIILGCNGLVLFFDILKKKSTPNPIT